MEPNKLEKDFKEKLEQRTIQPSDMAWDRLDAMLSVAENKNPKKSRTWMYMAAAFLVFLLVGVLFLNREKENSGIDTNHSVVTTESKESENNETLTAPATNTEAIAEQTQSPGKQNTKNAGAKTKREALIDNNMALQQATHQEALAANDKKATPTMLQANNDEKLLAAATPAETTKKRPGVKVDPNSLLSAVEEELDNNFKDKVLIGAVKNFNVVRSAVANRNYE